jgi:hypothetical protein
MGISQHVFEQAPFRIPFQRCGTLQSLVQSRARLGRPNDGPDRNALGKTPFDSNIYENRSRPHTLTERTRALRRYGMPGNRNILFLIIGALIVVVGVLGYNLYQSKKQPEGLQINVGPNGLKIENK